MSERKELIDIARKLAEAIETEPEKQKEVFLKIYKELSDAVLIGVNIPKEQIEKIKHQGVVEARLGYDQLVKDMTKAVEKQKEDGK